MEYAEVEDSTGESPSARYFIDRAGQTRQPPWVPTWSGWQGGGHTKYPKQNATFTASNHATAVAKSHYCPYTPSTQLCPHATRASHEATE